MSNGHTLHPSQQESGPSTRKTTKTDQNSTQPRKTTILPANKNLTNNQFTKEEIEIIDYELQHSIERPLTSYLTNLLTETERAIKLPDTKLHNTYRFMASKKLKQIISSGNHHNPPQKRQTYVTQQLNHKIVTENAIIV
jgi:hypothetical protein